MLTKKLAKSANKAALFADLASYIVRRGALKSAFRSQIQLLSIITLSPDVLSTTMPRAPKRRALTGCRRRKAKRQATPNERWLHLGARQAGQMRTIQTVMATTSLFCMSLNHFRALILAARHWGKVEAFGGHDGWYASVTSE